MTYICNNCQSPFDEVAHVYEDMNGEGALQTWNVCPHCGSGDFEEAIGCKGCGEYFPLFRHIEGFCPVCANDIGNRLARILNDQFFPDELDVLDAVHDGCSFREIAWKY